MGGALVGLDGPVTESVASPIPDGVVGRVGASQVIIDEASDVRDGLCTAGGGV